MTTEHIDDYLDGVIESATQLHDANEAEHNRFLAERRAAEAEAARALTVLATATRSVSQRREDKVRTIEHGLAQTARIRGDIVPTPQPEPDTLLNDDVDEPDQFEFDLDGLYTRRELAHTPRFDLENLAQVYGINAQRLQDLELIDEIVRAQHAWCVDNDVDDPNYAEFDVLVQAQVVPNTEPLGRVDVPTPTPGSSHYDGADPVLPSWLSRDDHPELYTREQLERMNDDQLDYLVDWYFNNLYYEFGAPDMKVLTKRQKIDEIVLAQHRWCMAHGIADPNPPTTAPVPPPAAASNRRVPIQMDVHNWDLFQWLGAIIGAVIGFIIALVSWKAIVDDIDGIGRSIVATVWWIAVIGFGFFLGGLVGYFVDEAINKDDDHPDGP